MKKLKTILQYKSFYLFFIILALLSVIYFTFIKKYNSVYSKTEKYFIGKIIDINYKEDYMSIIIKGNEKILCNYYYKQNTDLEIIQRDLILGNIIEIEGNIIDISTNVNFNQFNYKKYLYNNKIYNVINIKSYKVLDKNKNIFYSVKNKIIRKLYTNKKTDSYKSTFLIGKNNIESSMKDIYKKIGISHLMAISGMHISIFIGTLQKILEKLNLNKKIIFFLVNSFLFFYMFLTNFTASILRSGIMFFLSNLNDLFKLQLSKNKIVLLAILTLIIINPFIIYNIGFIFSSVVSLYLIFFNNLIKKRKNYFSKLFITSFIAWIVSFPIVIYNYFEVNILGILSNLICVPLVSFVVFPLSIISFIFKRMEFFLELAINLLEKICVLINDFDTAVILKKPNTIMIILYYTFISCFLKAMEKRKYTKIMPLIILLMFNYNYNFIVPSTFLITLDVSQGDSLLFHFNNKNVLIDTGGNISKKNDLTNTVKSFGIRRIDYLILTHGDYDHMGEAINLVNNFKVEKVIFNCGEFNDLEKELIKVLDKKKIKYYSCIKELNIDSNRLYFLQTKEYDNENDNSNVIYTDLNGYKFMFMGDASITTEKEILEKYNLPDIDILKVGHHGSKTSSSEEFINVIDPKYSIISVGKNNRYGHPNKEVLDNLKDSKMFRTDINGSIVFKIKNNKIKIDTCSP